MQSYSTLSVYAALQYSVVSHSRVYGFNRDHFISSAAIILWSIMHAVIIDSAMTAQLT